MGQRGNRMNWHEDKRWSDIFMPEIKAILGMQLLGEAPYEEDALRVTDLIVLCMLPVRVAVRMRKKQYAINTQYLQEFTVRSDRPSGTKTELLKILSGFGDFLFYGFEDQEGGRLGKWTLIDLFVFREHYTRMQYLSEKNVVPGQSMQNTDRSSSFCVFRYKDFPSKLIRASGHGVNLELFNSFIRKEKILTESTI